MKLLLAVLVISAQCALTATGAEVDRRSDFDDPVPSKPTEATKTAANPSTGAKKSIEKAEKAAEADETKTAPEATAGESHVLRYTKQSGISAEPVGDKASESSATAPPTIEVVPESKPEAPASNVKEIGRDNFEESINEATSLVEFYAPWCGHCKELEPTLDEAAKILKESDVAAQLLKVNADIDANKPLLKEFGVTGYPTLKVFQGKSVTDYRGPKSAEGIATHMTRLVAGEHPVLVSVDEVDKFFEGEGVIGLFKHIEPVVLEGDKKIDTAIDQPAVAFNETATQMRTMFNFAMSSQRAVFKHLNVEPPAIVFKGRSGKLRTQQLQLDADGRLHAETLTQWIRRLSLPPLIRMDMSFTDTNMLDSITKTNLPIVMLVTDFTEEHPPKSHFAEMERLGREKQELAVFIVAEGLLRLSRRLLEWMDMPHVGMGASTTNLVIFDPHKRSQYVFNKEGTIAPTVGQYATFVQNFFHGELQPIVPPHRDPELAEVRSEGDTIVATEANWPKVVNSSTEDGFVLVEFYAPWCGACQGFGPIYDRVAEHYSDSEFVSVAKFDVSSQQVPDKRVKTKQIPAIRLFGPASEGNKHFVYKGEMDRRSISAYVDGHVERFKMRQMKGAKAKKEL